MTELEHAVCDWLFGDGSEAEVRRRLAAVADPGAALTRVQRDLGTLAESFGGDGEDAQLMLEALLDDVAAPTPEAQALRWLFEDGEPPRADPSLATLASDLGALAGLCVEPMSRARLDDAIARLEALLDGAVEVAAPVEPEHAPPASASPAPLAPAAERASPWPWLALVAAAAVLLAVWQWRPAPTPAPVPPVAGEPVVPIRLPEPTPAEARFDTLPKTPLRPAMRPIAGGDFFLGSPPDEAGRNADEDRVPVTLTRDFWLAETEVTQAQWRAVMRNGPAHFKVDGDDRPVEQVNWFEAVAYANALSRREELSACYTLADCTGEAGGHALFSCASVEPRPGCTGYRLPTEAEWEYAARAGTTSAVYAGVFELVDVRDAPVLEAIAWYSGNSGVEEGGMACGDWTGRPRAARGVTQCGTHPVATKAANDWGLHDMIGNVWEWTGDWYAVTRAGGVDPTGPATGKRRVTKGCGWFRDARFCRAANRYRPLPTYRSSVVGFRVARSRP